MAMEHAKLNTIYVLSLLLYGFMLKKHAVENASTFESWNCGATILQVFQLHETVFLTLQTTHAMTLVWRFLLIYYTVQLYIQNVTEDTRT